MTQPFPLGLRAALIALGSVAAWAFCCSPVLAQSTVWTTADIGGGAVRGSAESQPCGAGAGKLSGSACPTLTIVGGGTGVAGASDQLTFVYQQLTGDGSISVRVGSIAGLAANGDVSVMIRETLSANAKQASLAVRRQGGLVFRRRGDAAAAVVQSSAPSSGALPVWLKIERRGTSITAFTSVDGSQWTAVGSATVAFSDSVFVGVAASSIDPAASTVAVVSDAVVSPVAVLPPNWATADIAAQGQAGSASVSGNSFMASSWGTGIADASDQFRFVYTRVQGDAEIVIRLVAFLGGPSRQAGVMIRESLDPDSAQATTMYSGAGSSIMFARRAASRLSLTQSRAGASAVPVWLKLERRSGVVTSSYSVDGVAWKPAGMETLSLSASAYVGFFVAAGAGGKQAGGAFDQVSIRAISANRPPTVSMTSPGAGQSFRVGDTVSVNATASDPDDQVASVDFFVNGTRVGTDTTSPYSADWAPPVAGAFTLTAIARDFEGASSSPATRAISVTADAGAAPSGTSQTTSSNGAPATTNRSPTVLWTAPSAGQPFTVGGIVSMGAAASDPDGDAVSVDFYVNGTRVATDATAPYTAIWAASAAGTVTISAIARDARGAASTAAIRTVTVTVAAGSAPATGTTNSSGGTTSSASAPTVTLTVPLNGQTFRVGDVVSIGGVASDPSGRVTGVDFYVNGALIATDATAPYLASWPASTAGAFTINAIARNASGTSSSPETRTIVVTANGASGAGSGSTSTSSGGTTSSPSSSTATGGSTGAATGSTAATTNPWKLIFDPSLDDLLVVSYVVEVYKAGTTQLLAARDLGKPAIINGSCTVNVQSLIAGLAAGQYGVAVKAVNIFGFGSASDPVSFVK